MTRSDKTPRAGSDPVGELYALPMESFTAARNALAASLRKAGRTAEADRVRGLPRPSLSAWTVNQLYWHERPLFDALITAGETFKAAQQAQLAGKAADLVGALDARRDALAALTRAAAHILHDAGHNPTADMMRRVTSTLDALAAHGRGPHAPAHGQLMADVPPPGFEALAALVPRVGSHTVAGHGTRRVLTFGEPSKNPSMPRGRTAEAERMRRRDLKARRAQAAAAVTQAEHELRRARLAAGKARDNMKSAAAKATTLERLARQANARAERATAAAEASRRDARKAAASAEAAVQALQDAELAIERARARAKDVK
jgi:methyl-accepting chemotaxis protein